MTSVGIWCGGSTVHIWPVKSMTQGNSRAVKFLTCLNTSLISDICAVAPAFMSVHWQLSAKQLKDYNVLAVLLKN